MTTRRPRVSDNRLLERWLVSAALGSTALALALTVFLIYQSANEGDSPATSLTMLYARHMTATRSIVGVTLIAAWPVILPWCARLLRLQGGRPAHLLRYSGVALGALTYDLSFLPWPAAPAAVLAIPAVLALVLSFRVLRLGAASACAFWLCQGILVLAVTAAAIWILESVALGEPLNPVKELPAIARAARSPSPPEQHILANHRDRSFPPLRWLSSGSRWLDGRANRAQIAFEAPGGSGRWELRLTTAGDAEPLSVVRGESGTGLSPIFIPRTDVDYWLVLEPAEARGGSALIRSLLPVRTTGNS